MKKFWDKYQDFIMGTVASIVVIAGVYYIFCVW